MPFFGLGKPISVSVGVPICRPDDITKFEGDNMRLRVFNCGGVRLADSQLVKVTMKFLHPICDQLTGHGFIRIDAGVRLVFN